MVHGERYNLAIQVDSQQVDTIYVYTATDLTDDANLFQWEVYYSDNGTMWFLSPPSPAPTYNNTFNRFELDITQLNSRYIMLVEKDIPTSADFDITRVEAFTRVAGIVGDEFTSRIETKNYLADSTLGWRIFPDLKFTYNLILEDGETAAGDDIDRTYNSGSLLWTPSLMFSSTLTASESRKQTGDEDEDKTRFYSAGFSSQLLPTLDVNVNVTKNDSYEDDKKTDTGYNYNFYMTAILFPDLSSNLDVVYITNRDEETNQLSQDFNSTLKFTARITPGLTIDLTENYTTSHAETETWTAFSMASVNWRPSDILSFQVIGVQRWEKDDSIPFLYYADVTIAPTYKTQLNLSYNHGETSDDYAANFTWTINKIFSVNAFTTYVDDEDSQFAYGSQLIVRY